MRKVSWFLVLALVAVAFAAAGCGSGGGSPETSPSTSPSTTPSTTPSNDKTMSVFFVKGGAVSQVARQGAPSGEGALKALLQGPTESEKAQGYSSAIPAGTTLLSYKLSGTQATVDLSEEVLDYGGGSAIVQAIMSQIDNTVLNNDDAVRSVSITVGGKPAEEVLQP